MAPRKTHILKVTQQGQHGFHTADYTLTDPRGTASDRRRSLMPTIAIFFIYICRNNNDNNNNNHPLQSFLA